MNAQEAAALTQANIHKRSEEEQLHHAYIQGHVEDILACVEKAAQAGQSSVQYVFKDRTVELKTIKEVGDILIKKGFKIRQDSRVFWLTMWCISW
jgi:hypothetical protein